MRRVLLIVAVMVATVGILAGTFLGGMEGGDALWPVVWIAWAPAGALILFQRPGNGVGVAMLATGLMWGIGFLLLAISVSDLPLQVRLWSDLVTSLLGVVSWLGIVWLILVFPSGRLEGWLARATAIGFIVVGVFGLFAFAISSEPLDGTGMLSPVAVDDPGPFVNWFVGENGFFVPIVLIALAIVSAIRRWYRSDGVERKQYRWLLLGALVFFGILTLGQVLPDDSPGELLWLLGGTAIPISVVVAVTRYHLYEIDRIISRTLSYAVVVGLLAGVVALVAALIGTLSDDPLVVAATTLGVAAVFNPLRRRVQAIVDRRFNRRHYDAERVTESFAASLRDRTDPDEVLDGWVDVVASTMEPSSVGIWTRS